MLLFILFEIICSFVGQWHPLFLRENLPLHPLFWDSLVWLVYPDSIDQTHRQKATHAHTSRITITENRTFSVFLFELAKNGNFVHIFPRKTNQLRSTQAMVTSFRKFSTKFQPKIGIFLPFDHSNPLPGGKTFFLFLNSKTTLWASHEIIVGKFHTEVVLHSTALSLTHGERCTVHSSRERPALDSFFSSSSPSSTHSLTHTHKPDDFCFNFPSFA